MTEEIKDEVVEEEVIKEEIKPEPPKLNKVKHKNLIEAFCAFQSEVTNPTNSKANDHFNYKYAPLDVVLANVRPILAKHGLAILQEPTLDQTGYVGVRTTLLHTSGETYVAPVLLLPPQANSAQGIGSAITYGRRYAISSLLGIASEDDDDGNAASGVSNKDLEFNTLFNKANEIGNELISLNKQVQLSEVIARHLGKGNLLQDIQPNQIQTLKFIVKDLEALMK